MSSLNSKYSNVDPDLILFKYLIDIRKGNSLNSLRNGYPYRFGFGCLPYVSTTATDTLPYWLFFSSSGESVVLSKQNFAFFIQ
jgi:hypothetical protein